nr:MAG TPA: glycine zipper [Caudoviricetes sp.]
MSGQWKLKDKDLISTSYESARGINSDFYDDMMATAGDTYVGIAVNAIPFGKIADLGKFTKISSKFKAGLKNAIGSDNYNTIKHALDVAKLNTVGAKRGFEVGMAAAGPVGGAVGSAAAKTGLYSAGKFIGKNLAPGMIIGGVIGSQFDDSDSQLGATIGVATGALLGGLFGATGGKAYMANKLG